MKLRTILVKLDLFRPKFQNMCPRGYTLYLFSVFKPYGFLTSSEWPFNHFSPLG